MKQENRKPFQSTKKKYLLSNIPINLRILLVCFLTLIPSVLLLVTIISRNASAEHSRKRNTEQTITAVAEQYVDTSVENIVAIAKAIYTNNALYNFLSTEYQSTSSYYDAFYTLKDNNSLIIAENSNIRKFTIYSENKTILSGGNIDSLAKAKDESWYQEFQRINKNMILYCDTATQTLSLIRRLDYSTIETGDCIMKIDINGASVQSFFEELNFDGNIYVMSDGVLLYSNMADIDQADISIDSSYSCFTKNYYTVEIEYYAHANKQSVGDMVRMNLFYGIPFACFYIFALIATFLLMHNVSARVTRLSGCYTVNGSFNQIKDDKPGKDEIGQLHSCCVDLSYQLERMLHEGMALDDQLERFRKENDFLLLQALHQDALLSYCTAFSLQSVPTLSAGTPVALSEELARLREGFARWQADPDNHVTLELACDDTGAATVLPLSLTLLADEMIRAVGERSAQVSLSFGVATSGGDCVITIRSSEAETAAGRLLKLRAIFEGERKTASWNFRGGYPYNPYIRLKEYYGKDIECSIQTDPTLTMTLTIHAPETP